MNDKPGLTYSIILELILVNTLQEKITKSVDHEKIISKPK